MEEEGERTAGLHTHKQTNSRLHMHNVSQKECTNEEEEGEGTAGQQGTGAGGPQSVQPTTGGASAKSGHAKSRSSSKPKVSVVSVICYELQGIEGKQSVQPTTGGGASAKSAGRHKGRSESAGMHKHIRQHGCPLTLHTHTCT